MHSTRFGLAAAALLLVVTAATPAHADIVFQNLPNNGFFTPFNSGTPAGVKYGDSGWLTPWIPNGLTLVQLDLGVCTYLGTADGTTDLVITFNDGDPSGFVFGTGAVLYQTVIEDVVLPQANFGAPDPAYFTVSVPLPNIQTLGGFNNVGFSVGVQNFNFDGQFGFQCSNALGQTAGFYTNNASFYDGSNWSLFAFGSDPTSGVANFVATMYTPEPASLTLLSLAALAIRRRR